MSTEVRKIAVGSDHAGYDIKEKIKYKLSRYGYEITDFGTFSKESMDYPDIVHPLAKALNDGVYHRGIIICGSGNGMAITANKYENVRAALCWNGEIAKYARLHNDANVLSIPARFVSDRKALEILEIFLITDFEDGRHKIRVDKISQVIK